MIDARLDMRASQPHFVDHLAAVWLALPAELRGTFAVDRAAAPGLVERAASHGIAAATSLPPDGPAVLVAGVGDLHAAQRIGRRRLAIMEHGAGQSYAGSHPGEAGRNPSYAGGYGRDAGLFLHPNAHAAARDRAFYRHARVEIVGAPFLDRMPVREPGPGPVVALTFHFEGTVAPEARPAFEHYRAGILELARRHQVIGHAHPRILERLRTWYVAHGIEVVDDFRDVLRRADVLVFDNTSAGFAFAASGRPTVVLDSPTYRRKVDHGLRFWECVGGPAGDGPARIGIRIANERDLVGAVDRAIADDPDDRRARDRAVDIVYAYRTGAADRAARVLADWLGARAELVA